jgi:chemotaxis protein histidine kinase CheA
MAQESTNDQELLKIFKEEAEGLIREMREDLRLLAKGQGTRAEVIYHFFRSAHTLKGSSGFVQYDALGELARVLEQVARAERDGRHTIRQETLPILCEAVDICQALLKEKTLDSPQELIRRLRDAA